MTTRTLYLIACAAPPACRLTVPISAAQKAGWDLCTILMPTAYRWPTETPTGRSRSSPRQRLNKWARNRSCGSVALTVGVLNCP